MTFAIPATVYNKKYNFIFIFFPIYLPNFSKKKSVNQLIKLEWPKTHKISVTYPWDEIPNNKLLSK